MSQFTDSASRPGQINSTGDDRALFLTEFGGLVITAYLRLIQQYAQLRFIKNITQGKSDTFPIIGRKDDATEHEAGELILGGKIDHNQVEITVDKMIIESVFIPEIDELLNHISVREPYAEQIGQSLGTLDAKRIAITHILASRKYYVGNTPTNVPNGQPAPGYSFNAAMKTSAAVLENALFEAKQYMLENDISGYEPEVRLPHQQVLLLARTIGLDPATSVARPEAGSGNRVKGTIGEMVGMGVTGTNFIPKTNITVGNTKYQGNFSTTVGHVSSKMAVGTLERKGVTLVWKDVPERLGTQIIGSRLNGHGVLRPECSYELATATR